MLGTVDMDCGSPIVDPLGSQDTLKEVKHLIWIRTYKMFTFLKNLARVPLGYREALHGK